MVRRLFARSVLYFRARLAGRGLLLMRVIAGVALISTAIMRLQSGANVIPIAAILAGLLLLAGLWTPVAGSLVAIIGIWRTVRHISDPWAGILLATLGVALAMVRPGAWSVDARLFGWKRIDVRGPKNSF